MSNLSRVVRTAVIAVAAVLAIGANAEVQVGDVAPAFSLAGSDGNTHTLADLKGKYVVVACFPKAFTKG